MPIDIQLDSTLILNLIELVDETLDLWRASLEGPYTRIRIVAQISAMLSVPLNVALQGFAEEPAPSVAFHWYGQLRLLSVPTQVLPIVG